MGRDSPHSFRGRKKGGRSIGVAQGEIKWIHGYLLRGMRCSRAAAEPKRRWVQDGAVGQVVKAVFIVPRSAWSAPPSALDNLPFMLSFLKAFRR